LILIVSLTQTKKANLDPLHMTEAGYS